jgi:hypothetical protein
VLGDRVSETTRSETKVERCERCEQEHKSIDFSENLENISR